MVEGEDEAVVNDVIQELNNLIIKNIDTPLNR
jgi:hypothetical protein